MTTDIRHEILIDAPADIVWRTVTEPAQIATWWTNAAEIDLRPGGTGTLTWTDKASHPLDEPAVAGITVETLDPPHTFAFRWMHPAGSVADATNSALVTFSLTPEGAGTRLVVTETGLGDLGWSDADVAEVLSQHEVGWAKHLGDLRTYVASEFAAR